MPKASDKTASESTGRRSQAPAKAPAKPAAKAAAKPVAKKPTAKRKPLRLLRLRGLVLLPRPKQQYQKIRDMQQSKLGDTMPGSRLVKMIKKVIIDRGLPDRAIADVMGITVIYWNSLANGNRQIRSLGKEKLQMVAEFLGLPLIRFTTWLISSRQKILCTRKILMSSSGCRSRRWVVILPGRAISRSRMNGRKRLSPFA